MTPPLCQLDHLFAKHSAWQWHRLRKISWRHALCPIVSQLRSILLSSNNRIQYNVSFGPLMGTELTDCFTTELVNRWKIQAVSWFLKGSLHVTSKNEIIDMTFSNNQHLYLTTNFSILISKNLFLNNGCIRVEKTTMKQTVFSMNVHT